MSGDIRQFAAKIFAKIFRWQARGALPRPAQTAPRLRIRFRREKGDPLSSQSCVLRATCLPVGTTRSARGTGPLL